MKHERVEAIERLVAKKRSEATSNEQHLDLANCMTGLAVFDVILTNSFASALVLYGKGIEHMRAEDHNAVAGYLETWVAEGGIDKQREAEVLKFARFCRNVYLPPSQFDKAMGIKSFHARKAES